MANLNFRDITAVPVVEELPEGANFILNDDGTMKQMDAASFKPSSGGYDIELAATVYVSKDVDADSFSALNSEIYFMEGSEVTVNKTYDEFADKIDSCLPIKIGGGLRYCRQFGDSDSEKVYYPNVYDAEMFFGQTCVHWNAETLVSFMLLGELGLTLEEWRELSDDYVIQGGSGSATKADILAEYGAYLTHWGLPADCIEVTNFGVGDIPTPASAFVSLFSEGCSEEVGLPALYIFGPESGEPENTVHVSYGGSVYNSLMGYILK